MEIKKNNTKFIIFEIIVIMLGIIGVTFAVSYVMDSINVNVDTAGLAVDYTGNLTLPTVNLTPIEDSSVKTNTENVMRINFTVKGASSNPNIPIIYDVILSDLQIDNALKNEYLKWELEKNGVVISSGSFSPGFDVIKDGKLWLTEIQQDLPTSSQNADSYEFRLWISESCPSGTTCTEDMDQSNMLNKSISGKIETVLYTKGKEALVRNTAASYYIESLLESNPETMNNDDPDGNVRYMGENPNNYIYMNDIYAEFNYKWKEIEFLSDVATKEACSELVINACTKYYSLLGFSSEEECNISMNSLLDQYGLSSLEEVNEKYCVIEIKEETIRPALWRIIGVFDVKSEENGNVEKRIKIVKDDAIGNYPFDNSFGLEDSNWNSSALMEMLNSGPYWNKNIGLCPSSGDIEEVQTCDFSITGLSEEAKILIDNAIWNLGGTSDYRSASNGLASHFYGYERGTNVISGYPTHWVGKIGLMYPSDYGYATSGGTTTNRASCLAKELSNWDSSGYSDCKNNDYIYKSNLDQWTITPDLSSSSYVFSVNSGASLTSNYASSGYAVRPTAYLKSSVLITSGDGSKENPYVLSN